MKSGKVRKINSSSSSSFILKTLFSSMLSYRVERLPQDRQPNLWRHLTRFILTTSGKFAINQLSTHGYWSEISVAGLGQRHWNLETSSAVVEFPPLYLPASVPFSASIPSLKNYHIEMWHQPSNIFSLLISPKHNDMYPLICTKCWWHWHDKFG